MLFPEVQQKDHWIGHWKIWATSPVQMFPLNWKDIKQTGECYYYSYMDKQHLTTWSPSLSIPPCFLASFLNMKGVWDDGQVGLRMQGRGFRRKFGIRHDKEWLVPLTSLEGCIYMTPASSVIPSLPSPRRTVDRATLFLFLDIDKIVPNTVFCSCQNTLPGMFLFQIFM